MLGIRLRPRSDQPNVDQWQKGNAAMRVNRRDKLELKWKLFRLRPVKHPRDLHRLSHARQYRFGFQIDQCSERDTSALRSFTDEPSYEWRRVQAVAQANEGGLETLKPPRQLGQGRRASSKGPSPNSSSNVSPPFGFAALLASNCLGAFLGGCLGF
jgi:hypothetical protein